VSGQRGGFDPTSIAQALQSLVISVNGLSGAGPTSGLLVFSGTTAQRPVGVSVGFPFFDTTLTLPIWWTGVHWINAVGGAV
jgi:hypothetical protein